MASAYQRGKRWYTKYRDERKRWVCRVCSALTRDDALEIARHLEAMAERRRLGLDVFLPKRNGTLADLCRWWLEHKCTPASLPRQSNRLKLDIISQPIGSMSISAVTAALLDEHLSELERRGQRAVTVNGLRRVLSTMFARAMRAGKWTGLNPVKDIPKRIEIRREFCTLRAEEVPALLYHTPSEWRDLFATAIFTGLRKGELFGLRKADVDLERRVLTVARSYDHETTKGRRADCIPIADALVPFLAHALEVAAGVLLFPDANGVMRRPELAPQRVLQGALARAGLVQGYEHRCRRCMSRRLPCTERLLHDTAGRCRTCGMLLWVVPIRRPMRFHDLRHTTATLLLRAGVDLHRVQRIMRHRQSTTTASIYGHLDVEDLREAVNKLPLEKPGVPPPGVPRRFALARTGAEDLMSAEDCARRLGLSRATVYSLCASGDLPHVRIRNAIRVRAAEFEAFLSARTLACPLRHGPAP